MTNQHRGRRARPQPCPAWEPTTAPNALTFEKIERAARSREMVVTEALEADPAISDKTVNLIVYAWPYLDHGQRARLLTLALTPKVRAAATAQAHELGLQ